jgi:hypothetical protein
VINDIDGLDELEDDGIEAMAPFLLGAGDLPIQAILQAHPDFRRNFREFDPFYLAATLGGLLTVPELQSYCCRLEGLSHLAVARSKGVRKPSSAKVGALFGEMSAGPCGRYEDPAEDAFTSLVTTPRGDFRILEGIWESAGFFLQRIINVVEGMPREGDFERLRESVYALLKISDIICDRAKLPRYKFGDLLPKRGLPKRLAGELPTLRRRVTFSKSDLRQNNVSLDALSPFVLGSRQRTSILRASLSHSPLLHRPLLERNGRLVIAMPTAISIAIRWLVISSMLEAT